jgi:tripartite-type tricarboxylate transporter receptor subunit TctC
MKQKKQNWLKAVFFICIFQLPFLFASGATADDWPPEKIEIITSHDVGSGQDTNTRAVGELWQQLLGTQFIYKNKKGASGRIGYDFFINQTDEDAMLSSNITSASIMYAQQKPDWKWEDTLYAVGILGVDPGAIFTKKDSPFKSLNDLIAEAKKRKVTFAISFWASPDNLLMHQIMELTGAQFEIVPYGNSKDLVTQVLAGNVEAGYTKIGAVLRGGDDLTFLAMSLDENPVPAITNNCPTIDEVLGAETIAVASYRAILLKKAFVDKYPDRAQKIIDTLEAAKVDKDVLEKCEKMGIDPNLVVKWDHARIMKAINRYWLAFEKYGDIYKREK